MRVPQATDRENRSRTKIALVGGGVIGSHAAPLIARIPGVTSMLLIDGDTYSQSNLRSQAIMPTDVGRAKVDVLAATRRKRQHLGRRRAKSRRFGCDPAKTSASRPAPSERSTFWLRPGENVSISARRPKGRRFGCDTAKTSASRPAPSERSTFRRAETSTNGSEAPRSPKRHREGRPPHGTGGCSGPTLAR